MKIDCQSIYEKYRNNKLTLPAVPHEFLEVHFENEIYQNPSEHGQSHEMFPFAKTPIFSTNIKSATLLTNGQDVKPVYELILNYPENLPEGFLYEPGDTIGILPRNDDAIVNLLINHLHWREISGKVCKIKLQPNTKKKGAKIPMFIPQITSLRIILKDCLDLNSIPKKLFLLSLSQYADNEAERFVLAYLSSKEGANYYSEHFASQGVTIKDVLTNFETRCPLSLILEHCPRLMPRPYSLASCPLMTEKLKSFKIVFSMLTKRCGVTTNMLQNLIDNSSQDSIYFYFRTSTNFIYNSSSLSKNVIMIGPGVGIAPFMSFLEHRNTLLKDGKKTTQSKVWLFTGCRYQNRDQLYEKELNFYLQSGVLSQVFRAFSRDGISHCKYVQNLINEHRYDFVELLWDSNTRCYVCGGINILPEIENCIMDAVKSVKGLSDEDAKGFMKRIKMEQRYLIDSWL